MKISKTIIASFVLLSIATLLAPMAIAATPIVEQVTGGGWYFSACDGNKCTFGFNAEQLADGTWRGNVEFVDHGPQPAYDTLRGYPHVHGYEITNVEVTPTAATIWGNCRLNGDNGPYAFRVDVTDVGEPGTLDTFEIQVFGLPGGDYISLGELGFTIPEHGGGNIQTHRWPVI